MCFYFPILATDRSDYMTIDEAVALYDLPLETLLLRSKGVMEAHQDKTFDFCTIINGKNGKCSEDCKYCAQSAHFDCDVQSYDLLSEKEILLDALDIERKGIGKYSIVTSGKRVSNDELDELCNTYKKLTEETKLNLCASHGLLNHADFKKLKIAGVKRIHNNLESSRRYFEGICTTHSYDEKIETIKAAQEAGLEVCSGGIIGMGESREDRVQLAFELKNLGIKSVPLNLLNPIEGTPIGKLKRISEEEFYKTCAIYRLIMPDAIIRLAGGRGLLSDKGKIVFEHCINGTITGELLTTSGNDTKDDIEMIRGLGYEI